MLKARASASTTRLTHESAMRSRSIIGRSLAEPEAGAESAPVEDEVRDGPDREHDVDDDQPGIDAPAARGDFAVRVLFDVVLVRHRFHPLQKPPPNMGAPQLRTPIPPL